MIATTVRETPDIETASEDYARRFAGRAGAYLLAEQERAVRHALRDWRGVSVLDVGGGHAQLLPILQGVAPNVAVLGSDEQSLTRVRRDFPGVRAVTGNLLALPFADRSFDLVTAVRLVPHVERWERLLEELCRVARRSVLVDYPRVTGANALTPLLFPVKKRLEGNTRHYRNFTDAELDEMFKRASFEPRLRRAQFVLPMVVHRRLGGALALQHVETLARSLGLTDRLGSPVIVRADLVEGR
jgi:ubiquinone/menaquinone biosynthesis C-methylase UbiE